LRHRFFIVRVFVTVIVTSILFNYGDLMQTDLTVTLSNPKTGTATVYVPAPASSEPYRQPGREGTSPITVHFPKAVRKQLKALALERDHMMHELRAEALNDLFAKYGKARIAPQ
jgi:hypothetical protein